MGFIPGLIGLGDAGKETGSGAGIGFQAQQGNLGALNKGQITSAINGSNAGMGQQQQFLNALKGQGGIGNQSSVFQQQQQLANQLQNQANGGGPNPALSQLQGQTGNNIANQAAMMAGQRGAGANAGLMARQIANQGAGIQQQANNQAATLQAQQQLAAQNALMGQQQAMGSMASQQVGQQAGANQALIGNQQNQMQGLLGANVGMQSNINNANANIAGINAKNQAGAIGGALGGLGSMVGGALGAVGLADGGMVPSLGVNTAMPQAPMMPSMEAPAQKGFSLSSYFNQPAASSSPMGGDEAFAKGASDLGGSLGKAIGGLGKMAMGAMMSDGGHVPGSAPVSGDSQANDTVPAMLSPGEVVIPRSKVFDPEKTAKFINALLGYDLKAGK